jgi:serine/threonine-protein kinase
MTGALHSEAGASVSSQADTPLADPFLGRTIDGKYLIEQRIGRGGSGTVYRARHTLIHRPVAIKLLSLDLVADPDSLERFRREAQTAGNVKHVNLVPVTDFGMTPDGVAYLVMDFIEGGTLRKILDREKTLPPERVVRIMKAVCSGMHAAHRKGIIHRDLKPDNVMIEVVDEEEMPRVLDFGIAKLMDAFNATSEFRTETGSVMGTPHYMSPEQCEGRTLDVRSDIYSLGVLAYEMLTGAPPFSGKASASVMMQQVTKEPPPLRKSRPDLPEAAEACILRALAKDPAARQTTTIDFFFELEAAFAPTPKPEAPAERPDSVVSVKAESVKVEARAVPAPELLSAGMSATPSGGVEKVSGFVTELQRAAAKAAPIKGEITEKFFTPPPAEKKPVAPEPAPALSPAPEPVAARQESPSVAPAPRQTEAVAVASRSVADAPPPVVSGRKPSAAKSVAAARASVRPATPAPMTPQERRKTLLKWARRASAAAAFGMCAYAVVTFAAYKRMQSDLDARCAAILRDPATNIATLRDRVKAALNERGVVVSEKSLRIQADPPNRRVDVRIDYVRPIFSIPLRYQVRQTASNYPLPIAAVATVKPTEIELVNTSRREIERYRLETQRRAASHADHSAESSQP